VLTVSSTSPFAHPCASVVGCVRVPDGGLGVEADAVRGGRLAQPCQRHPQTSLEVCTMTRDTCALCPELDISSGMACPGIAAPGVGGAGGVSAAERARSGHGLDEAWIRPGAGPQACRGRRLGVVGRLPSFPFEGRDALCVRLIGASCQPWPATSPCVATGQAEIAAEGGAGRRPAQRRGRADASISEAHHSGTTEELKATRQR
jgi:hypothetical protein